MGNLILLVGPQGTGKTSSFIPIEGKRKGLNLDRTYLIKVANKELPARGAINNIFSEEKKNLYVVPLKNDANKKNFDEVSEKIVSIINLLNSPANNKFDTLVIDDIQYLFTGELSSTFLKGQRNYDIYTSMAKHIFDILLTASQNTKVNIIVSWHPELDSSGMYEVKTAGQLVKTVLTPEGLTNIVLYTHVDSSKERPSYHFITNRWLNYPAKSPEGMFDDLLIPNDMGLVLEKIQEYYK